MSRGRLSTSSLRKGLASPRAEPLPHLFDVEGVEPLYRNAAEPGRRPFVDAESHVELERQVARDHVDRRHPGLGVAARTVDRDDVRPVGREVRVDEPPLLHEAPRPGPQGGKERLLLHRAGSLDDDVPHDPALPPLRVKPDLLAIRGGLHLQVDAGPRVALSLQILAERGTEVVEGLAVGRVSFRPRGRRIATDVRLLHPRDVEDDVGTGEDGVACRRQSRWPGRTRPPRSAPRPASDRVTCSAPCTDRRPLSPRPRGRRAACGASPCDGAPPAESGPRSPEKAAGAGTAGRPGFTSKVTLTEVSSGPGSTRGVTSASKYPRSSRTRRAARVAAAPRSALQGSRGLVPIASTTRPFEGIPRPETFTFATCADAE